MKQNTLRAAALAVAIMVPAVTSTKAQKVDASVAAMPMREFGKLSMFVRHDILKPFKKEAADRLEFDACMIAVASDPRTYSMTVEKAVAECLAFAAGK